MESRVAAKAAQVDREGLAGRGGLGVQVVAGRVEAHQEVVVAVPDEMIVEWPVLTGPGVDPVDGVVARGVMTVLTVPTVRAADQGRTDGTEATEGRGAVVTESKAHGATDSIAGQNLGRRAVDPTATGRFVHRGVPGPKFRRHRIALGVALRCQTRHPLPSNGPGLNGLTTVPRTNRSQSGRGAADVIRSPLTM